MLSSGEKTFGTLTAIAIVLIILSLPVLLYWGLGAATVAVAGYFGAPVVLTKGSAAAAGFALFIARLVFCRA
jgi:hypothetical protein